MKISFCISVNNLKLLYPYFHPENYPRTYCEWFEVFVAILNAHVLSSTKTSATIFPTRFTWLRSNALLLPPRSGSSKMNTFRARTTLRSLRFPFSNWNDVDDKNPDTYTRWPALRLSKPRVLTVWNWLNLKMKTKKSVWKFSWTYYESGAVSVFMFSELDPDPKTNASFINVPTNLTSLISVGEFYQFMNLISVTSNILPATWRCLAE